MQWFNEGNRVIHYIIHSIYPCHCEASLKSCSTSSSLFPPNPPLYHIGIYLSSLILSYLLKRASKSKVKITRLTFGVKSFKLSDFVSSRWNWNAHFTAKRTLTLKDDQFTSILYRGLKDSSFLTLFFLKKETLKKRFLEEEISSNDPTTSTSW